MALRTITPRPNTPTANMYGDDGCGKKTEINGIKVWLKGQSPSTDGGRMSPYNERAAYLVDKMLGLNLVPTTVLRLYKGEVVSAQRWIYGKRPTGSKPPILLLFDYIISNGDRHNGNWLVKPSGKVWAIDNAMSFDFWAGEFCYDKKLSEADRVRLEDKLKVILAKPRRVHKQLDCLIGKDGTKALLSRMKKVLSELKKEGGDKDGISSRDTL